MNGIIKYRIIIGCISFALLFFCVSPVMAAQKKYKDKTITFYYPETWELSTEKINNYEIKLRPKNWLSSNKSSSEIAVDDFALYISISNQTMEKAATESTIFKKEDGKWKIEGRQGIEGDVKEIKGKNWKGILGEAPVSRFYKGGGYFGLGWASTAIISDGKITAVLKGDELGSQTGQNILESIEFIAEYEAGFDCKKAKSEMEKTICSNSTLAALDKRLNLFYHKLISNISKAEVDQFKNDQRAWLKSCEITCANSKNISDCIKDAYDQRVNLFEDWSLSVRTNHFKEDYSLEKDPSMIPLEKIPEEPWRSRERYRLVADFNNDGIDDVALSYDTSMFGNAGGQFFLYLGKGDGTYREIGSFFAHPLAINLKKTITGEGTVTTYARSNAGSGFIVEERITSVGIFMVNRKLIQPGDAGVPEDQKLYGDLFGNATRIKAEISETKDNVVMWKPFK